VPTPQVVVDTDVLILHLRGNESVGLMLREVAQASLLCCSAMTIGEIHALIAAICVVHKATLMTCNIKLNPIKNFEKREVKLPSVK
jgi:predicted nucleic acid-binding protein